MPRRSGWYIDADAFTKQLVSVPVDKYRELALSGTMTYFDSLGSVLEGLGGAQARWQPTRLPSASSVARQVR